MKLFINKMYAIDGSVGGAGTNVAINTGSVNNQLNIISGLIDELNTLYSNINPDLTGGWDSNTSKNIISPKIQNIKDSINSMSQSVDRVRGGVSTYSKGMVAADTSGAVNSDALNN